jgi:hypothetical protein
MSGAIPPLGVVLTKVLHLGNTNRKCAVIVAAPAILTPGKILRVFMLREAFLAPDSCNVPFGVGVLFLAVHSNEHTHLFLFLALVFKISDREVEFFKFTRILWTLQVTF